ncbi:Dihydroflavonol-4-reductase [Arthrobotrys entomopaga]|nr:Dihydroflavonol-4-reductase [Arthrobotrys entomopaga]
MTTSSKPIALVTGVTGYIAGWVVKYYLDAGYKVRGTTRNKTSAQPLIDTLISQGYPTSDIEIYEVADITTAGAFDEAVKDVEVIAHLATPVSLSFTDPDPVIRTAREGTLSILRSAKKASSTSISIKTFIQMSSVAAVWDPTKPGPYTFSEKDWNESAVPMTEKLGNKTPGFVIYMASKVESERALWKFKDEENPDFDIVSINPAWVSGPPVVPLRDASKIGETIQTIWQIFSGKQDYQSLGDHSTYIHAFDVARLFVWAAKNSSQANGERYLALAGKGGDQAVMDILGEGYPSRRGVMAQGEKGKGYNKDYLWAEGGIGFDISKAVEATGEDWIKYDTVVLDTAKAFEHLVEL